MDGDDIGVLEFRDGARLLDEALHKYGITRMEGWQDLDRDIAIKRRLIGLEDRRHATRANALDYTKLTERSPNESIKLVTVCRLIHIETNPSIPAACSCNYGHEISLSNVKQGDVYCLIIQVETANVE